MLRRGILAFGGSLLVGVAPIVACGDDPWSAGHGGVERGRERAAPRVGLDAQAKADAGAEADTEVPANAVRVTVIGGDVANIPVFFGNADGDLLEVNRTGADGRATSAVQGIATVTAGDRVDDFFVLTTWIGVKPGENLMLRSPRPERPAGILHVRLAGRSADEVSAAIGTCYATRLDGTTLAIPLGPGCDRRSASSSGMFVSRRLDGGGAGFEYAVATTDFPWPTEGSTTTTDVTSAFVAPSEMDVAVAGFVRDRDVVTATACIGLVHGEFSYRVGCSPVQDGAASVKSPADGSTVEASFGIEKRLTEQRIMKRTTSGSAVTLDASQLLPRITNLIVEESPDQRLRPSFSWSGDTRGTDGGRAVMSVYDNIYRFLHHWTFVVPPGTNRVKLPELGRSFFPENTSLSPGFGGFPSISFLESDAFPDAAAFRQRQGLFDRSDLPARSSRPIRFSSFGGEYLRTTQWERGLAVH